MIGIANLPTHQLVTSTNAHYRGTFAVGTDDGLRHSVAAQLIQIGQSAFRTGQQDDIRFHQLVRIVGVEQVYTRIALQDIEVGEIA